MARLNAKNYGESTLSSGVDGTSDVDFVVQAGDGAKFPTPPFRVVVGDDSQTTEIVEITSVSTDTLSCGTVANRGLEGTSIRSHSAGIRIENVFTAGAHSELFNHTAGQITSYGETAIVATDVSGEDPNFVEIDLSLANVFQHTLDGDVDYAIINPKTSGVASGFTLIIIQDDPAVSVTFPASVLWADGNVPTLDTDEAAYVLVFMTVDGGTTWYGAQVGEFDDS